MNPLCEILRAHTNGRPRTDAECLVLLQHAQGALNLIMRFAPEHLTNEDIDTIDDAITAIEGGIDRIPK